MLIVTPRLVQPVSDISKLRTPIDGLRTPNDIEEFLGGMIEGRPVARSEDGLDIDLSRKAFDKSGDEINQVSTPDAPHLNSSSKEKNSPNVAGEVAQMGGLAAQYGHSMN